MKNIFIISGPSGAGEDSVIEGLKEIFNIERVITTSTRLMRSGESQRNPYYFISKEEFETKIKNNEMAEYAREYNDQLYGVAKKELERVANSGKIGIWKMEYKGVMTAKRKYPEIISIFLMAPSLEIFKKRILKRGGVDEDYVNERMKYTKEWLKHKDVYDYEVINEEGKLDETIDKVAKIIKKHSNIKTR